MSKERTTYKNVERGCQQAESRPSAQGEKRRSDGRLTPIETPFDAPRHSYERERYHPGNPNA